MDVKSDKIQCTNDFNSSESLEVDLLERGVALASSGSVRSGRWTPVANQGFEVRMGENVYFFFSDWDDATGNSICSRTRYGYSNVIGLAQQRTFRCASAEMLRPTVSDIQPVNQAVKTSQYEEPEGHKMWVGSDLPVNFSWSDVNGISYLPPVFDQENCGSCYAVASTQAMMARIMVATNKSINFDSPENRLSVQHILDCSSYSQSCDGGFGEEVAKFSEDFGILTVGGYKAYGANVQSCDTEPLIANGNAKRYHFTNQQYLGGYFGADNTVDSMMWELYRYGPFPVSVYVDD